MHELIRDRLEGILEGERDGAVNAHLEACRECRETVSGMTGQAHMLSLLRAPEQVEPVAGFYGRVIERIEAQVRPSIWDILLEPAFGRRLVYASLTMVLLMGTYLAVAGHAPRQVASSPEIIMAAPASESAQSLGANPERDREAVLVTLTAFGE